MNKEDRKIGLRIAGWTGGYTVFLMGMFGFFTDLISLEKFLVGIVGAILIICIPYIGEVIKKRIFQKEVTKENDSIWI